jgi:hypothetical protein
MPDQKMNSRTAHTIVMFLLKKQIIRQCAAVRHESPSLHLIEVG